MVEWNLTWRIGGKKENITRYVQAMNLAEAVKPVLPLRDGFSPHFCTLIEAQNENGYKIKISQQRHTSTFMYFAFFCAYQSNVVKVNQAQVMLD